MIRLALRNMLHDRLRLAATLVGITFAVMLIFVQMGLYFGFMRNASALVDHTVADIWIVDKNAPNVDFGRAIPERYVNVARSTPGVARAETLLIGWTAVRLPKGGDEKLELIGYHPEAGPGWGQPWGFVSGGPRSVLGGDNLILDESSYKRLGRLKVGDRLEVIRHETRIAAMTSGIRSLTTSPYAFTEYETAFKICPDFKPGETVFILVQVAPTENVGDVVERLKTRLPQVDVLTRQEFSDRSRNYWAVQTGLGFGFFLTAMLGLVVGVTVVGQTIYAETMEHLKEYATLKALGADKTDILTVLWTEAGIASVVGYALGGAFSVALAVVFDKIMALSVVMPQGLWVVVAFLTLGMCLAASTVSVRKVIRLDPAIVFGGP